MTHVQRRALIPLLILAMIAGLAAYVRLAPPAYADTTSIAADDNGWVQENQPTTGHCGATTNVSNVTGNRQKSSFQFPVNLPVGSTITAATLRIYATTAWGASGTQLTAFDRDVAAPDGCAIQWSTADWAGGGAYGLQLGQRVGSIAKNTYVSIPLTTNLAQIATTGRTGIVVTTNVASGVLKFKSDAGTNKPFLDLTYSVTPTTTTSTTVAPTTTTEPPPPSCGGPITITAGGTYSGCYESLDPAVSAVKVQTTAAVTLDGATVRHEGKGVEDTVSGANLTVRNTSFQGLDNGGTFSMRAVELQGAASFVFENNLLVDGHGMWIGDATMSPYRVRYNEAQNIGRYPHPTSPNCCIQFLQSDDLTVPGGEVAWNRVTNQYGQSNVEDIINNYRTSGSSANPFRIHHNLLNGAWPRTGDGAGYTGGGVLAGDAGGQWVYIEDNRVVNTGNYGVAITDGSNNRLARNRVVSDNTTDTGAVVMSDFANAMSNWCYPLGGGCLQGSNNDTIDSVLGLERRTGARSDWWTPTCDTDTTSACTGLVSFTPSDITPAHEQAEVTAFASDAAAAGVTIGPGSSPPPAPETCDSSVGAPVGSPVSGPTSYTGTGTITVSNRIFDGNHADDLVRVNNGHVIFDHVTFKGVGTGTTGHSLEVKLGGSVEVRDAVFEGDPAEDHFQTEGNDPSRVACSEFRTTPGEDHLDTKSGATVTIEDNKFLAAPTAQVLQNHNGTSPVHFLNNSGAGLTKVFYESGQTRGTIVGNTITQSLWLYDATEILVRDNVLAQVKHGEGSSTRDPIQTYFLNNQINDALNNGGTCYRDGNTGAEPVAWCTAGPPPWYGV